MSLETSFGSTTFDVALLELSLQRPTVIQKRLGRFVKYRDLIENALNGHGADYCEIRIEETDSTRLVYRGKSLDTIAQTSGLGGNVRAVTKGGWGFASFNSFDELATKVADAVAQSKIRPPVPTWRWRRAPRPAPSSAAIRASVPRCHS